VVGGEKERENTKLENMLIFGLDIALLKAPLKNL
jgi:hypothetical protein